MEKKVLKFLCNINKLMLAVHIQLNKDLNKPYLRKSLKFRIWAETIQICNQE